MRSHFALLFVFGCTKNLNAPTPFPGPQPDQMQLLNDAMLDIIFIDGLTSDDERKIAKNMTPGYREVPRVLDDIKFAQTSYEIMNDVYIAVQPYPKKDSDPSPQKWEASESGAFSKLEFTPPTEVRGTYWVDVVDDGKDFRATGIIDLNGDGTYTTYVATKDEKPKAVTEEPLPVQKKTVTDQDRIRLANTVVQDPKWESAAGEMIIGALLMTASRDEQLSENEKRAIEVYRKILAPDITLEQALNTALEETKKLQNRAKESEVPVQLKGIMMAEIEYHNEHGKYLPVEIYPPKSNGDALKNWDVQQSGNFSKLSYFYAPSQVRGSYWVELTDDGNDFLATGIIDIDGDGSFTTYTATKSRNPTKE